MAQDFLSDINVSGDINLPYGAGNFNLNKNEIQNARLQNLASEPSTPVAGQIYYNTATNLIGLYNGTIWLYFNSSATDRDRANHTGTQLASTISDFDTQVRTNRLDQLAAPTANVSINNNRLTNVSSPVSLNDAANKTYVDSLLNGIKWKQSVRVATTANITLSGAQTIDGVSAIAGDRVLVKNQSTNTQNGIYVIAAGSWTRATDFDLWTEIISSAVFVEEGTTNADTCWNCTVNSGGTVGSTAITFVQFAGPSGISAGIGLTQTGGVFDVNVDNNAIKIDGSNNIALKTNEGISGSGLDVTSSGVKLSLNSNHFSIQSNQLILHDQYKNKNYLASFYGNGSAVDFDITHNMATRDVVVQIWDATTYATVIVDVVRTTTNKITVKFKVAPASGKEYRVYIIGYA